MANDTAFVFGVVAVAAGLMASNRVRFDVVALLVVLALMLSGVLTVGETLGVSPYPYAVTVLIAASAAFATPVSTPCGNARRRARSVRIHAVREGRGPTIVADIWCNVCCCAACFSIQLDLKRKSEEWRKAG